MKKLISIVMAVIMMTVTATGAFVAPTNSVPFTNSPDREVMRKKPIQSMPAGA